MKLLIVFTLLGLSAQIGDLQAREPSTFFKPWRSTQSQNHNTAQSEPHKLQQQRPHRQSHDRDRRPRSLRRAGDKVLRLEYQREKIALALKRARRHHANQRQLRQLKRKLRFVSKDLHLAQREYRHLLHASTSNPRPQRWRSSLQRGQHKPS